MTGTGSGREQICVTLMRRTEGKGRWLPSFRQGDPSWGSNYLRRGDDGGIAILLMQY